ncbi:hypothetical protein [Falsiroseomonas sp.]|uniref:hypothetical protein n=1 Tax=Falsiroseomonas sp. TaxID=2870721 RepID=UPI00356ABFB2
MADDKDEKTRREQAEASQRLQDIGTGARPATETGGTKTQGSDEASPGASGGQRLTGAGGIASGVQRGGTKPGGGPGAGLGSLGTGGASTGGAATGNVKRGGS